MKNIMVGRSYKTGSVIETLDPRVKLLFLLVYVSLLFYSSSFSTLFFSLIVLLVLITISRVPFKLLLHSLIRLLPVFFVFAIITALTLEDGVREASVMIIRLISTVLASSLFSSTTPPRDISRALDRALGKGHFKKSVHILSTIVLVAFRFIPILQEEEEKIMDAQLSRGASFDEGGIIKRAEKSLSLIVPLFVSAFRRADELAISMDSRMYNKEGATSMYPLKYNKRDITGYILILLYLVLSVLIERLIWI